MTSPRLGVVGTLVWDRHVDPATGETVAEGWGGIAYALAALGAALPPEWAVRPLVKVGGDMAPEARALLGAMPRVEGAGLVEVDAPNNRVELRYHSPSERSERLLGGVPAWSAEELTPLCVECDAIYVNFVSGMEIAVDTMADIRRGYAGPIYADLHSLFLSLEPDGLRAWRRPEAVERWLDCFDAVQVNERELSLLADGADPWGYAREIVRRGPRLLAATLGREGAALVAAPEAERWPRSRTDQRRESGEPSLLRARTRPREGDPTGCGDVWGAAFFARLLAGDRAVDAMHTANRLAGGAVERRTATGLATRFAELLAGAPAMVGQATAGVPCTGGDR